MIVPLTAARLDAAFPALAPFGEPERLAGGNLNFVWRARCASGSVVVKHAPPWAVAAPQVALSPRRLLIEARALSLLAGPLARLGGAVRTPAPRGFDRRAWLLVTEDVGPGADLSERLEDEAAFTALGGFIGRLHRETLDDATLRRRFDNAAMQRARRDSQYALTGALAHAAGAPDAQRLGADALELGQRWIAPGRCLVMGDLWLPSVLLRDGGLRLIDWELAHFGSPAQDVGHLLAHVFMHGLAQGRAATAEAAASAFLGAWRAAWGASFDGVWTKAEERDAALHFGCEVLARALGPFRGGGPLGSVPVASAAGQAALQQALAAMRGVSWLVVRAGMG